jgi:hypothetical protein
VTVTDTVDAASFPAFAFLSFTTSFRTALRFSWPCLRLVSLADGSVFPVVLFCFFAFRPSALLRAAFLEPKVSPYLQQLWFLIPKVPSMQLKLA